MKLLYPHSRNTLQLAFRNSNFSLGFTLIEIMVVFSMLMLLGGVGFASFVSYSRRQAVEQASYALKTQIEKAKFNAISKVASSACVTAGGTLESYSFRIVNTTSYETSAGCRIGASINPIDPQVFRMPQNVTLNATNAGPPKSCRIKFETLSSIVSVVEGNCTPVPGAIASLDVRGYGITKSVQVDSSGNVRLQ